MRWPWNKKDVKDSTEGDEILQAPEMDKRKNFLDSLKVEPVTPESKGKLEKKTSSNEDETKGQKERELGKDGDKSVQSGGKFNKGNNNLAKEESNIDKSIDGR